MRSTTEILDHQQKCFTNRDLDGLLADYAADAVFFGPEGALKGPEAIRPLFQRLFREFSKPGVSFTRRQRLVEGEFAHTVWSAETADNLYEFASDTFLIQKDRIRFQAFFGEDQTKEFVTATQDHGKIDV